MMYSQQLVFVIPVAVTTVSRLLMTDIESVRNKIKLRNSAFCWLLLYEYITMHGPQNVKL